MKKFKIIKIQIGYCPCCKKHTFFIANDYWLRDHYHCFYCHSIPRQRAFMKVLQKLKPEYEMLDIHESSPSGPCFIQIKKNCSNYTYSYFYEEKLLGSNLQGGGGECTNQNLESMTFPDNSFDVFITQDVFEHINNPVIAFQNIERVLRPGGLHIFTVPIYPFIKTRPRTEAGGNENIFLLPPIYHGNPINRDGCLVTYDWGGDILDYISACVDMDTEIYEFKNNKENFKNGLEGDFLQVIVSRKRYR